MSETDDQTGLPKPQWPNPQWPDPQLPAYARTLGITVHDSEDGIPVLAVEFGQSVEGRPLLQVDLQVEGPLRPRQHLRPRFHQRIQRHDAVASFLHALATSSRSGLAVDDHEIRRPKYICTQVRPRTRAHIRARCSYAGHARKDYARTDNAVNVDVRAFHTLPHVI